MKKKNAFQGLPMEHLIGAPLSAICDGQAMLASATKDYIESVGFDEDKQLRMIDFKYQRPVDVDQPDGSIQSAIQNYSVQVPFISIVSVPTLNVDSATIDFTMEVKSVRQAVRKSNQSTENTENNASGNSALMSAQVKRPAIVASLTKQDNQSTTSYKVSISAKQAQTPEGLSRLMDILHRTIEPVEQGKPEMTRSNAAETEEDAV